jgi:hypothetical protein
LIFVNVSSMARDIEQELDAIFAHHKARVTQARSETAARNVAGEDFGQAAATCLASVITPALEQMAQALNHRGVAARVLGEAGAVRIDIPVSRHARLGHGLGGYPYLRARPDPQTRRIRFERNTSDGRGGNAVRDHALAEVSAEAVKELVVDLVRELYGPF